MNRPAGSLIPAESEGMKMDKYYDLSYAEYLVKANEKDSRQAWISWKVASCGMSIEEATKAGYDPDWGWEPGLAN